MLLGIDVGGTFTDGVIFGEGKILKTSKRPTDAGNLKASLLAVLDDLIKDYDPKNITRLVLSTTLVTNLIATGYKEKIALILIPGQGMPFSAYQIFPDTFIAKGAINFRGEKVENLDLQEIDTIIKQIKAQGITKIAVVAKFSNRNAVLESQVSKLVLEQIPAAQIALGSSVAGQLNFIRRMVTTYYTLLTAGKWERFTEDIRTALQERDLDIPVEILKADAGTLPLNTIIKKPCETVFSGPAASTMGAMAINPQAKHAIVLDIGGTTTDIALLIDGKPLHASHGAKIQGHYSHIKALAVYSLPLGGDSPIDIKNDKIQILQKRQGAAVCFGGQQITITDVFNIKQNLQIGNYTASRQAVQEFTAQHNLNFDSFIDQVVEDALNLINDTLKMMFTEWENEPIYKVWEVVHERSFQAEQIIGIGAAAPAIIPLLSEFMQLPYYLHAYSPVANALGACLARPTMTMNLHIDTAQNFYAIDYKGIRENTSFKWDWQLSDAQEFAQAQFLNIIKEMGIEDYQDESEFISSEQFNIIRSWERSGKIMDIGIQITPGLIKEFKGVEI